MPIDLFMSQLSPTMTEGKIARWLKKEGDELISGEVLVEVETDKATMEMEVVDEGVLHRVLAAEGSVVAVGAPIAIVAEDGEEIPADYQPQVAKEHPAAADDSPAPSPSASPTPSPVSADQVESTNRSVDESAIDDGGHDLQLKDGGIFNVDGEYDLVVIGAGPGGYVAAIRAAQLGLKTACIESTHLGGICLNWGCIPTKALLRSAELVQTIRQHGKELGLGVSDTTPDLKAVIARSRKISTKLNKGIAFLFKKHGVTHIEGFAHFESGNKLVVEGGDSERAAVTAKHVIVATGAHARVFPGMEIDGEVVITYKQALVPETLPKEMIIIGSGAIGMEFAYFYNAMGSKVTVIEGADHLLPIEDAEISAVVERSFRKQGVTVVTGATVTAARADGDRGVVTYRVGDREERLEGDRVLVAVGVVGNTDGIGLENTTVTVANNTIDVDAYYRTDHAGIYAIGDVIGAPALAHVASHEGVVCVEAIAGGKPHPIDYSNIPGCTYCQPQVGSTGLTEAEAIARGIKIKVGRMPYAPNGKALGLGESEGMVKIVFNAESGELIGAHIVGAEATELIVSLGLARTLESTEEELIEHIFPHPTLSEMIHEAVLDSENRSIHQ
ncbi:MAG: dihydrolipoyl dehydrogenase [Mariprofundales bacterium]|nr:dihydrolipoyl dehydrogenase [Mariprofundales bacterium]